MVSHVHHTTFDRSEAFRNEADEYPTRSSIVQQTIAALAISCFAIIVAVSLEFSNPLLAISLGFIPIIAIGAVWNRSFSTSFIGRQPSYTPSVHYSWWNPIERWRSYHRPTVHVQVAPIPVRETIYPREATHPPGTRYVTAQPFLFRRGF